MPAISLGVCTLNSMNRGVAAESKLCVVFTGHVLIKDALFIPVMYRAYTVPLLDINNRSIFRYGGYSDQVVMCLASCLKEFCSWIFSMHVLGEITVLQ